MNNHGLGSQHNDQQLMRDHLQSLPTRPKEPTETTNPRTKEAPISHWMRVSRKNTPQSLHMLEVSVQMKLQLHF